MDWTRRFLGGRHPLCGIGVTSRIERICKPAVASAWIADSRPDPGPWTRTCTRFTPMFTASRAACSAATVAANGVDFFDPLKPALPEDPQVIALPCMSVIVISVLLNVAVICAMPSASTTFFVRFAPVAFACAMPVRLLFQGRFLLACDRATRPLLGPRVRMRPLPAHRQPLAVPPTAVRADIHQPLDVHRGLGAQRALDLVVPLDDLPQPRDFSVAQVAHARVGAHPGLHQNLLRVAATDAEDVRQRVGDFLVARQVNSGDACHASTLPLFVLRTALADDPQHTATPHHLAVLADRTNARSHLQAATSGLKVQLSLEL